MFGGFRYSPIRLAVAGALASAWSGTAEAHPIHNGSDESGLNVQLAAAEVRLVANPGSAEVTDLSPAGFDAGTNNPARFLAARGTGGGKLGTGAKGNSKPSSSGVGSGTGGWSPLSTPNAMDYAKRQSMPAGGGNSGLGSMFAGNPTAASNLLSPSRGGATASNETASGSESTTASASTSTSTTASASTSSAALSAGGGGDVQTSYPLETDPVWLPQSLSQDAWVSALTSPDKLSGGDGGNGMSSDSAEEMGSLSASERTAAYRKRCGCPPPPPPPCDPPVHPTPAPAGLVLGLVGMATMAGWRWRARPAVRV